MTLGKVVVNDSSYCSIFSYWQNLKNEGTRAKLLFFHSFFKIQSNFMAFWPLQIIWISEQYYSVDSGHPNRHINGGTR